MVDDSCFSKKPFGVLHFLSGPRSLSPSKLSNAVFSSQADGLDPATTVTQIPSSSGTTGPRKGVMLSHRNEVARMMFAK